MRLSSSRLRLRRNTITSLACFTGKFRLLSALFLATSDAIEDHFLAFFAFAAFLIQCPRALGLHSFGGGGSVTTISCVDACRSRSAAGR